MLNTQLLSKNWEPKEDKPTKPKEHKPSRVLKSMRPTTKNQSEPKSMPEET